MFGKILSEILPSGEHALNDGRPRSPLAVMMASECDRLYPEPVRLNRVPTDEPELLFLPFGLSYHNFPRNNFGKQANPIPLYAGLRASGHARA